VGEQSVAEGTRHEAGTLVLLHAAGLDRSVWRPFVDCVSRSLPAWDVLAIDLLGHGSARDSDPLAGGDLLDSMTDALQQQLEDVAGPIVVMGASVGGVIAQKLAIRQVAGIHAVVLCGTLFDPSENARDALRLRAERTRTLGAAALVGETVARWFPDEFLEREAPTVDAIGDVLLRADTEVLAQVWEGLSAINLRSDIARIEIPALVLCGSADKAAPPSGNEELAELLPRGIYHEFVGAGHLVPIERPTEAASVVSDFITRERVNQRVI
jgi:pimeloyl-ACP methyl ester carboxylesterase